MAPGEVLAELVAREGFLINNDKFRVAPFFRRQMVTGIVVNSKKNLKRSELKSIRAILFKLEKDGIQKTESDFHATGLGRTLNLMKFLKGKISFVRQVRGKDDFMSIRFSRAFNRNSASNTFVSRVGSDCMRRPDVINPALFRMSCEHSGEVIGEGTGFAVSPRHIISCAHVCMSNTKDVSEPDAIGADMEIIGVCSGGNTVRIARVVAACQHQDLILLEVAEPLDLHFLISTAIVDSGEEIFLFGYGRIGGFDRTPRTVRSTVSASPTLGGVKYIQSTHAIFSGDSGGPAIDSSGRIVGVMTRSEDSELVANGIVSTENKFFDRIRSEISV